MVGTLDADFVVQGPIQTYNALLVHATLPMSRGTPTTGTTFANGELSAVMQMGITFNAAFATRCHSKEFHALRTRARPIQMALVGFQSDTRGRATTGMSSANGA